MEELADKLGFVETVLCLHPFPFLSSSSVSLFYVSVTALNKSAMWKISVCCDLALGSAREARGGRRGRGEFRGTVNCQANGNVFGVSEKSYWICLKEGVSVVSALNRLKKKTYWGRWSTECGFGWLSWKAVAMSKRWNKVFGIVLPFLCQTSRLYCLYLYFYNKSLIWTFGEFGTFTQSLFYTN